MKHVFTVNPAMRKMSPALTVGGLQVQLASHAELWNELPMRTQPADSPHREVDDIWVRYSTNPTEPGPHDSVWYPSAELLPAAKELALDVLAIARGTRLGGVLLTRIPAGKSVHPHTDHGWHARYYRKFAVHIAGDARQAFRFESEQMHTIPGEWFEFDNSREHWVTNPSNVDRITLIVCIGDK